MSVVLFDVQGASDSVARSSPKRARSGRGGLVDESADQMLDRLGRTAARLMRGPVALVTLIDADGGIVQRAVGLAEPWADGPHAHLALSLCRHALAAREPRPVIIADLERHPLPGDVMSSHDADVAAYLGVPLQTYDGHVLGTVGVMDFTPREWEGEDIEAVQSLGAAALLEFQLRAWAEAVPGPATRRLAAPELRGDGQDHPLVAATEHLWELEEQFFAHAAAYERSLATASRSAEAFSARALDAAQDELRRTVERYRPEVTAAALGDGLPSTVPGALARAVWALWRVSDDYCAQLHRRALAAERFARAELTLVEFEHTTRSGQAAEAVLREAVLAYRAARQLVPRAVRGGAPSTVPGEPPGGTPVGAER